MELLEKNIYNGLDEYRENTQRVYTRQQIGEALGYRHPRKAIENIHARHEKELQNFCSALTVRTEAGKREVFCYNLVGTMRICVFSSQPRAKELLIVLTDRMKSVANQQQKQLSKPRKKLIPLQPPQTPEEQLLTPPKWIKSDDKDEQERYRRCVLFVLPFVEKGEKLPRKLYYMYCRHMLDHSEIEPTNCIDTYRDAIRKSRRYCQSGGTAEKLKEYYNPVIIDKPEPEKASFWIPGE